jgi:pyruvate kinase
MDQEQKQMLIGGVVGTVVTLAASYAFMGGKSEPKEEAKKTETPKADDSKKIADLNAKIAALEKTLVSRPAEKELNIPTFFPLANVKADIEVEKRHSKIICTLGPACNKKEQLVSMIDAGLNVARLNFSHGDHESHGKQVETLKEALKERPDKRVALMLDTKGPEIRTGNLKEGKNITLKIGQALEITTDYTIEGDNTKISCSYPALAQSVKVGQTIFIADGSLTCKVTELKTDSIMVKVMNDATIGQKKNMNLPGVVVKLPILSVKDTEDIKVFGAKHKIDMVAASFVQSADNVNHIRDVLKSSGQPNVAIISKIEN